MRQDRDSPPPGARSRRHRLRSQGGDGQLVFRKSRFCELRSRPPPEYSLSELRDAQGRQRLYLHAFYHAADESAPPLPETRGAVVDNNNFADACGSFGVTAYAYRGKWADGGDRSLYIGDKQTVRNNGTYDFSPSVFWPGEEFKLAFFAYAPYGAIDPDGVGRDGLPEFSYTVPDKIEDQKDLLA